MRLVRVKRDIFFHYILCLIIKGLLYSWKRTSFVFSALHDSSCVFPFLHQPPKTCVCVGVNISVISQARFGQTVEIIVTFSSKPLVFEKMSVDI